MEKSHELEADSIRGFLKSLKIEPFFLIFLFAYALQTTVDSDLIFDRVCRLNFLQSLSNCTNDSLGLKNEVQKVANNYKVYMDLVQYAPSIIIQAFLGPWCDKYGRKVPTSLAILGMMLQNLGFIYIALKPDLPVYSVLVIAVPAGLSGGQTTVMGNVYSLASEQSTKHDRTFKYALLELGKSLGFPLGMAASGQLKRLGYEYIFITSELALILSLLWLNFVITERIRFPNVSVSKKVKDLFDISNLKESFYTCAKKREHYGRAQLLLLTMCSCLLIFILICPKNMEYFYTMTMYEWDYVHYSNVSSLFNFLGIVVSILFTYFFTKKWRIKETTIGLVGSASAALSSIIKSIADTEWLYYLGSAISLPSSITSLGVRSIVSLLVELSESGKVFVFIATCESLIPLAGNIVITWIYNGSLDYFPGLFLLVCGVLSLFLLAVFAWIRHLQKDPSGNERPLLQDAIIGPSPYNAISGTPENYCHLREA